jgi:kynurenine formamidase
METDPFHSRAIDGWLPSADEVGPAGNASTTSILEALQLPQHGRIYDLDVGRWSSMPLYPSEPPFRVLKYRSPMGVRNDPEFEYWSGGGYNVGWNGDFLMGGGHTGTHLDALSHITEGEDAKWYGGFTEREHLSDFGPTKCDGAAIPPFICRGILIDVPSTKNVDVLPAGYEITLADVQAALQAQETEVKPGDAVLVRTGYINYFDTDESAEFFGSGIGIEASRWLADQGIVLLGADNEGVENLIVTGAPTSKPIPVHVELLIERGVYLLEMAYLEALSRDRVYEFLFVCSAPRTRGTTGAFARPLALA